MSATFGRRGDFFWYQSERKTLNGVLEECYNFLKGKCFAVTAFDSAPLSLSEEDRILGWSLESDIAYSPRYESSDVFSLPAYGFDEWFVLDYKRPIEVSEIFVNYGRLNLIDGDMTERFWDMLERVQPYTYMSEGTVLSIVSKDAAFISQLSNSK